MKAKDAIPYAVSLLATTVISPTFAQTKYVFLPGSRQAVPADSVRARSASSGSYNHTGSGGMSLRRPGMSQPVSTQTQNITAPRQRPVQRAAPQAQRVPSRDFVDFVQTEAGRRPYRVHLPTSFNRSKSYPVVLVFSGLQMTSESMIGVTGFNGIANRNDFIVVYGESARGEWEDGMKNQRVDDVAYVKAVLARLAQIATIDEHRIYAAGLSNGGYFSQLLACSMPERIAAVAVVASTGMEGALRRSTADKAIPIVFFIGTEDPLINWGDGKSKNLGKYADKLGVAEIDPSLLALVRYGGWLTVPDLMDFWTSHNRCSGAPRTSYEKDKDPNDGMRVKKESWGNRGNEVVLFTIEGGGHTWPGNIFLAGRTGSQCCQDINTGEEIWNFFRYQSR